MSSRNYSLSTEQTYNWVNTIKRTKIDSVYNKLEVKTTTDRLSFVFYPYDNNFPETVLYITGSYTVFYNGNNIRGVSNF